MFLALQATSNPLECKVCLESYDLNHRPRTLPCGHPLCSPCITQIIKDEEITCPTCRQKHQATDAAQFNINFGMEELLINFRAAQFSPTASGVLSTEGSVRGISKKLQEVLVDQKDNMSHVNILCQEREDQLQRYEAQLVKWMKDHQTLSVRLKNLMDQNERATNLLQKEKSLIHGLKKEVEERKKQNESMTAHLGSANSPQEADAAIEETDKYIKRAEDWKRKCQQQFPDAISVRTSLKVKYSVYS